MSFKKIGGVIKRRILINYRMMPELIKPLLPPPFRPRLHNEFAIAGICLVRLEELRPAGFGFAPGFSCENAAHRVAVEWTGRSGQINEGVYVLRRDTDSWLASFLGKRGLGVEQNRARFRVSDDGQKVDLEMTAKKTGVAVQVRGQTAGELWYNSGFKNLAEASDFFEREKVAYSNSVAFGKTRGLRLDTSHWKVEPFSTEHIYSSFFGDKQRFPESEIFLEGALIMRNARHEWSEEAEVGI